MVTILEAITVLFTFRSFNYMCKETEIIAQGKKGILMNTQFPFSIQIGKDTTVATEQTMYITHKIV